MGFCQNQFGRLLIAGSLLAVVTTGCGKTRSALTSRVDVSEVMGDEASLTDEHSVNERIAAERSKKKPTVAEAAEHLLASSEEPKKSWKERLLGKGSEAADDFGSDPFLDDLDEMIATEAQQIKRVAESRRDEVANSDAAALFGDLEKQARQTVASLDNAASNTKANAADLFDATTEDVFGNAESVARESRDRVSNRIESGREALAAHVSDGKVVHRFEDLFGDGNAQVQQTAARTSQEPAAFEVSQTDVPKPMPPVETMPSVPDVPTNEDLAGLFGDSSEPAAGDTPALDIPESPATAVEPPAFADEPPAFADESVETLADLPQQDAVVTSNKPAAIPSLPASTNEVDAALSESDFAAMDRVKADPYEDPSFVEPVRELPPVNAVPPVQIPMSPEPAPRFSAVPQQPVQSPPIKTAVVTQPAPLPVSPQPPVAVPSLQTSAAAVLPNVNWQGQPAQSVLRAPSEWTAWFLMGGAALIVLLLFAPSRRTE